jgi:hypothetical protein
MIARTVGMVFLLCPVGLLNAQQNVGQEPPSASDAPPRPEAAPSAAQQPPAASARQAPPSAQPVRGKLDVQLEPVAEDAVRIRAIRPGGAADRAGIRVGDILLEIDEASLSEPGQAATALQEKAPGDKVTLTILRDGLRQQIPVVLSAGTSAARQTGTSAEQSERPAPATREPQRPPTREPQATDASPEQQARYVPSEPEQGQLVDVKGGWLGVAVEPGGEDIKGLRVMRVFPAGPAARAGIRKDAVLLRVEGQPLYEPEDLSRALEGTQAGQVVTLTLVQGPAATPVEKNVPVRLGDTSRIARRPILTGDDDEQRPDSYAYWEDSQGFATQIPPAAVELEFQRRLAEQNERIERLLISLREEIDALRGEVAALKASP